MTEYRSILKLALPVVVAQAGNFSIQIVDTVMVGHLTGAVPLAGISLAYSLSWPVLLFGLGIAMGLTPLVGRSSVRGDRMRVATLFKNSLVLGGVISLVLMAALGLLTFGMDYLGQDPEVLPIARGYMYFQIASVIPLMMAANGRQMLEGLGNTRHTMNITLAGNLLNIALNFWFIYGWWFVPAMGAVGAGAATFVARMVMVLMYLRLFLTHESYSRYVALFRRVKTGAIYLRRLFNIGVPIAGQMLIEMGTFSIMVVVTGLFGAEAQAAQQIAINIPSFSFMIVIGVASATTIRVSQDFGLRLYAHMKTVTRVSLNITILFEVVGAVAVVIFAYPLAGLFSGDAAVVGIAAYLLYFIAGLMLVDGIQAVVLGALRGLTEVNRPMVYSLLAYGFIAVPLGWLCAFPLEMGPAGLWVGFVAAIAVLAILYIRLFRKKLRRLMAV